MRYFSLILFAAFFYTLEARTDTVKYKGVRGGFTFIPVEFPIIDLSDFNRRITDAGMPSAEHSVANIGLGIQVFYKRYIYTFSCTFPINRENVRDNYIADTKYSLASFNVAYSLLKNRRFSLYPYAGFKWLGIDYLCKEQPSDEISFDNYLRTDLNYKKISGSKMNLDFGLGFSHQSVYLLNIRAGFLLPLAKTQWKINDYQFKSYNSPNINCNFYLSLIFGFGFIEKL